MSKNDEELITIYKNKGEVFNCHIDVEGATEDAVEVRLCLEFEDNKNLFFYGKVHENGDCEIGIPKLKDIDSKSGKLTIEAIADSTYFKLYEAKVNIKNSVEINFSRKNENIETNQTKVSMNKLAQKVAEPAEKVNEEEVEEPKQSQEKPTLRSFKDFKNFRSKHDK